MKDHTFPTTVTLPDVDDFLKKYPRFSTLANGIGRPLFDAIMQPELFINARVLADYGYPSVLAVADVCQSIIDANADLSPTDSMVKQYIGSVVCTLMEANGYKKSEKKKSVPHKLFSVAEHYIPNPIISRIDSLRLCGSDRLTTSNVSPVDKSVTLS